MELESYGEEEFFELGEEIEASEPEPVAEEFSAPERQLFGMDAVLAERGGESEDWTLEYRGDSGYRFDGENVRGPDGEVWVNEDAALHAEMLALWREGEGTSFFLPDYRERTETGENLYVTQLLLAKDGAVSYEIYKHEISDRVRENEVLAPEADGEREAREYTEMLMPEADEERAAAAAGPEEHEIAAEYQESVHERAAAPGSAEILRALGMPLMHSFGLGSTDEPENHEREPVRASRDGIIMETFN